MCVIGGKTVVYRVALTHYISFASKVTYMFFYCFIQLNNTWKQTIRQILKKNHMLTFNNAYRWTMSEIMNLLMLVVENCLFIMAWQRKTWLLMEDFFFIPRRYSFMSSKPIQSTQETGLQNYLLLTVFVFILLSLEGNK